eukprot:TRINITY_DN57021_c0_g1_i1.p1 TRINITY_DN57021_c0_g1~~TRINITY_DN57021_c0_g1_i1.p1  ORF type:complete len:310 (-),score=41.50 TRINITY_DN57021_c0_g1_i1:317-1246(-)
MKRRATFFLLAFLESQSELSPPPYVSSWSHCPSDRAVVSGTDLSHQVCSNNASIPPALRGAVGDEHVVELLTSVESCTWSRSRCFGGAALDCKLPMDSTTKHVAEALLSLVLPPHCEARALVDGMTSLPVRKFPAGAAEAGHVDIGPGWTVLLHLSDGATAFHSLGQRKAVPHTPGDTIAWWNTGSSPEHSWESTPLGKKVVVNFGVEMSNVSSCDGISLTAAGCFDPTPILQGFGLVGVAGVVLAFVGVYTGYPWWELPLAFWTLLVVLGMLFVAGFNIYNDYHDRRRRAACRELDDALAPLYADCNT